MPRILIVDDDEAYRAMVKAQLASVYEIIDTAFAEEALVMAIDRKPDAILLDLSMKGMSGFELCQTLSSLSFTQQIPIFIISGQDERNRVFCQNLGAWRYFTKPIDFVRLKEDLAKVIGAKKAHHRRDLRVQLKLPLALKGKREDGSDFEIHAATENVSKGGFLCTADGAIEEASSVEVFLSGGSEHHLGDARLVRVTKPDALHPEPRYGFQFTGMWTKSLISASLSG